MKRLLIATGCVCAASLLALAQDEKAGGFKTTFSAGVALTDGNSETLQANAALVTAGEKEGLGSARAGVEGNYGESTVNTNTEKTVENVRAFGNVKKTITPRTFGGLNAEFVYDEIAEIDYRFTIGPSLGVYLLKNDQASLSIEAGPSYVWEKIAGVSDDYLALRFAERFDYAISQTAKLWQSAEYLPKSDDFDDYLLSGELGIEAALNASMSLRIVLQDKYDSTPGDDLENNDVILIAGITVSL